MRTLVDIEDGLLEEALSLTQAKSKKEVIHVALKELIRAILRQQLAEKAGSGFLDMSLDELKQLRMHRQQKHEALSKAELEK
jgi:Arc/MetJ family transcription regulator